MKKISSFVIFTLLATFMSLPAISQDNAPKYSLYYYQRASLFDELPVENTDIIMLGNSITDGCEWQELFNDSRIKNRGISGDVVQGVRERLGAISKGQPSKIFLMIGVNNLQRGMSVDTIKAQYVDLIEAIKREMPNTRLYVESVLPVDINYGKFLGLLDKDEDIRILNAWLTANADRLGYTYVDLYNVMADSNGKLRKDYTNDGLHLKGKGYLAWRDALLPYLND